MNIMGNSDHGYTIHCWKHFCKEFKERKEKRSKRIRLGVDNRLHFHSWWVIIVSYVPIWWSSTSTFHTRCGRSTLHLTGSRKLWLSGEPYKWGNNICLSKTMRELSARKNMGGGERGSGRDKELSQGMQTTSCLLHTMFPVGSRKCTSTCFFCEVYIMDLI